jgi:thiol-disulfide isomerase/thioredoxin
MKLRTALLLTAGLATMAFAQGDPSSKLIGKPAPKAKYTTFDGKSTTLAAHKGKVILLDFWATWCGPCKASMPMVQRLAKQFAGKQVVVLGVSTSEEIKDAIAYVKKNKFTYSFGGNGDELATAFGVSGIPQLYIIDKKGVVRMAKTGFNPSAEKAEEKELATAILKYLGK